jgi:hypothetical protein
MSHHLEPALPWIHGFHGSNAPIWTTAWLRNLCSSCHGCLVLWSRTCRGEFGGALHALNMCPSQNLHKMLASSHTENTVLCNTFDIPTPKWWNKVSRNLYWLVVYLPLWKIWKSVGMIKKCEPNHQPVFDQLIYVAYGQWILGESPPSSVQQLHHMICFKHVVMANYSILAS